MKPSPFEASATLRHLRVTASGSSSLHPAQRDNPPRLSPVCRTPLVFANKQTTRLIPSGGLLEPV
jgi:hypothetical protein